MGSCYNDFERKMIRESHNGILRGGVKVPTGGKVRGRLLANEPVTRKRIPVPTVTVWM